MKHQQIYDRILVGILEGKYPPGKQIPTEHELASLFNASRPTVGRALRELEQKGLIYRRRGAGTFVRKPAQVRGQKLGILVPGVTVDSGELFGTMVSQMSREASEQGYALLLNDSPSGTEDEIIAQAKKICQQLIDLQVGGVFFMPLELPGSMRDVNYEIVEAFDNAGVGVALLDRDISISPERSKYDLIGINNERASYTITEHLIKLGCRKIDFLAGTQESSSIIDRMFGYQNALIQHEIPLETTRVHRVDIDPAHKVKMEEIEYHIREIIEEDSPDAIVCVNDRMAALLMKSLIKMKYQIPEDIRVVGFDDLPFITYLPVPLTTIRQPADALAREAVRTLLDRMKAPDLPARDIILSTELIVRESCGAKLNRPAAENAHSS